ncbi:MAG: polysaccharide deacetylase family protein [Proteobacteria bacterium]|nr:polysaccharide deacetylase family protein [Pseudomonadota bacterium]MBU4447006.1 polysaccharide deacetylase family protein [Pseudomonadota bacterium]
MHAKLNQIARFCCVKLWPLVSFFHKLLIQPEPGAFRILMLHDVPESKAANFHRLLQYLLEDYGILTPQEAEARLTGESVPLDRGRVPYLLTFDDGFKSNIAVAREVLEHYGIKSIFFVCPGFLDLPRERHEEVIVDSFYEGKIDESFPEERRLMSWDDCQLLVQSGHTIGAHSLSHRRLTGLDGADRFREIVAPGQILESRLGVPVKWFAYPFGGIDGIDAPSLEIIGSRYSFCCSGLRGINLPKKRALKLLREQLLLDMPFEYQQLILSGALDFYHYTRAKRLDRLING